MSTHQNAMRPGFIPYRSCHLHQRAIDGSQPDPTTDDAKGLRGDIAGSEDPSAEVRLLLWCPWRGASAGELEPPSFSAPLSGKAADLFVQLATEWSMRGPKPLADCVMEATYTIDGRVIAGSARVRVVERPSARAWRGTERVEVRTDCPESFDDERAPSPREDAPFAGCGGHATTRKSVSRSR
jgi:hypothetical protein